MARRRKGSESAVPSVQRVTLQTRSLVVVKVGATLPRSLEGAIVWIQQASDTKPEELEAFRDKLRERGVFGIKVLPREGGDRTLPEAVDVEAIEVPTAGDLRAVVIELVEEANTADRARLRAAVETALEEAGL